MAHLDALTNLEDLLLGDTQITDAGMIHLKGLTKLERLELHDTKITDAGLVHLKGLTNIEWMSLSGFEITDAGLVHLEDLTSLEDLCLWDTKVTDEGVKKLREALPNCDIHHLDRRERRCEVRTQVAGRRRRHGTTRSQRRHSEVRVTGSAQRWRCCTRPNRHDNLYWEKTSHRRS